MQHWRFLLLETLVEEAEALLAASGQVGMGLDEASRNAFCEAGPVHAILTRGKGQVNPALLDACQGLEVVARCGVGLDNVDVRAATDRQIKVINAPGSNAQTVAEHALTLMLMLQRQMVPAALAVREGNWGIRNGFACDELQGKTLGVLGMGNIGQRVARLGAAFEMEVVYWDPYANLDPYESLAMHEVLRRSDVVSLHVPLLPETQHLIGQRELELMHSHALLINTARGGLIDQTALTEALQQEAIGGFGADVLEAEPPEAGELLLSLPNTLITPHVASLTSTTYRNLCVITAERVVAALDGRLTDTFAVFNREELA
ncbi:MAG: hydroxyacid dehydrogenase [Bacteroidota bacterium]